VSFAESNAAIYANSISKLKTNKEGAFSALASALTGRSPFSDLRKDETRDPNLTIRMKTDKKDELAFGLLGYYAGKIAGSSVAISGVKNIDKRSCKSLCAGMGTSGACGMFTLGDANGDTVDFDKKDMQTINDEIYTEYYVVIITIGCTKLVMEE